MAAFTITLRSNDKSTAKCSRRLSPLSCPPNWASSRGFRLGIFLHRLIAGKRGFAREGARRRAMAPAVGAAWKDSSSRESQALKRHAILRALRRQKNATAHVRIGIAGDHPQAFWRGRASAPQARCPAPATLGLHQTVLCSRGFPRFEASSARRRRVDFCP